LHAFASASVQGGNGVYLYGSGGFPTNSFNATNYWVDVLFDTVDRIPPGVTSVTPAAGATGVSTGSAVAATFGEELNAARVANSTFELRDAASAVVPASVSYSSAAHTATLQPLAALTNSATYTARLVGGPGGVADLAGNPLVADYSWSFTTEPPNVRDRFTS